MPQRLDDRSGGGDRFEHEAVEVARRVVAGQDAGPVHAVATGRPVQRVAVGEEELQRVAVGEDELQRAAAPGSNGPTDVRDGPAHAARLAGLGPSRPLPPLLRERIEPRLGVPLGGVELHTGPAAATAAAAVGARAFTLGNHIALGAGESAHDRGLLAHEATHVVQQGAAAGGYDRFGPRDPQLQRLPRALRVGLASYARHIPGYSLFTVVVGVEPLTGDRVPRTAENLVGGLLGLVPFGTLLFDKLVELGVVRDAVAFVEAQLARFDLSLGRLERLLGDAWDEMDFLRLDPFAHNLAILRRRFGRLLADVTGFATSMVDALLTLIREAAVDLADGLLSEEPAWALIKKVLGHDPLRDEPVEATTVEILEDFLVLIGREQELEQMRERGTLAETAAWLDEQLGTFHGLLGELGAVFTATWEAVQPVNLPQLPEHLASLATRSVALLQGLFDVAWEVASQVLELIKLSLRNWLSEHAHEAPGFHLLTVLLERNPFTDEAVPRTAENLIRGFITLLPGGEAAYEQLAESGVIGRAAATIEGALVDLGISWELITGVFRGIWDSLSIDDLIDPIGAFQRIVEAFGAPLARIFAFIRVVLTEVISLILQLMDLPARILGSIIDQTVAAYEDIKRDPVAFVVNLLAAFKEGFSRFFDDIFDHLLSGLTDWLFRGLRSAGIEPPAELTLASGLELVMEVLGLTVDRLWEKLAERIGQERVDQLRGVADRLTGLWGFVRDIQEGGLPAIWTYVRDQLSGLWEAIIEQARDWVMRTIVERVVARLLTMLDPSGVMAVVNSFVTAFAAIQSAVEYVRDLLEIVERWVGTVAAVARGDIDPGAARLEAGLIASVPVAIGFLANQVGLGNVGHRLEEIVAGLRGTVDEALDWLLGQAERLLAQALAALGFGPEAEEVGATGDPAHDAAVAEGLAALGPTAEPYLQRGRLSREDAEAVIRSVLALHPVFTSLELVDDGDRWSYRWTASRGTTVPGPPQLDGVLGQQVEDNPELPRQLAELGYVGPFQRQGRWVIRVQAGKTHLDRLSVDPDGIVVPGPLRDEVSAIDQPWWVPDSDIRFPKTRTIATAGGNTTVGEQMVAAPLTTIGPGGSTVDNDNPLWDVLRHRPRGAGPFWVQGHLLNADLHGSGSDPRNLTPISPSANAQHRDRVERKVKDAVLARGQDIDAASVPVVHYEVTALYGGRGSQVPADATQPVKDALQAERQLATSLVCTAWHVHEQGGRWTDEGRAIVSTRIDLTKPDPPVDFTPRP